LHSSTKNIRAIKSKMMRRPEHVAHIEEMSNAHEIFTEKQKQKDIFEIHLNNEALWEVGDGNN
jgi:hypothetical protein